MEIVAAVQTPDGIWRVETVQDGARAYLQIRWQGVVIPYLAPESVREILEREGVDMGTLVEVPVEPQAGSR